MLSGLAISCGKPLLWHLGARAWLGSVCVSVSGCIIHGRATNPIAANVVVRFVEARAFAEFSVLPSLFEVCSLSHLPRWESHPTAVL